MKQTALEWLYEEFTKTNYLTEDEFYMIFNQAKEMEKEQIMDAYIQGSISLTSKNDAEQYYKETYESND